MRDSRDPHAHTALKLLLFGGLSLINSTGDVVGQQRRRLALLALLSAANDQGMSRDRLVSILSPESSTESARHALHQLLYYLRQQCGDEVFLGTDPLRLNPLIITSDLHEFEVAIERGELARAATIYRGPLLDGFHLDSAEFEEWAAGERSRVAARYGDALFRLAQASQVAGDHAAAIEWWRQLATVDPLSTRNALGLMQSLAAAGDTAGALRHARLHETLERTEFGRGPDPEVAALAARLQGERNHKRLQPQSESAHASKASRQETDRQRADEKMRGFRGSRVIGARGGLVAAALLFVVMESVWMRNRVTNPESALIRRSAIVLPDSAPLASLREASSRKHNLAISSDGKRLAYVAQRQAAMQLYLRELDQLDATPLPGTEAAYQPFFSPDGEWIGFFAGRDLKKVSVHGGPTVTLAAMNEPQSGAWTQDGRILVVEKAGVRLSWVPSAGGAARSSARQLSLRVRDPQLVLDDRWMLHASADDILFLSSLETGESYAVTVDGVAHQDFADAVHALHGTNPRYLECGHIIYFSADGVLMALPFDLAKRRALGPPAAIHQGSVHTEGVAQLTVSLNGTLVYAAGPNARRSVIVWLDYVAGRIDTLPFPEAGYRTLKLSPDGRRILAQVDAPPGGTEWRVLDIERGAQMAVPTGLTPGVRVAHYWWPDGESVVFGEYSSSRAAPPRGVRQSLINPADHVTMARVGVPSPDGRHLLLLLLGSSAITHDPNSSSQPDSGRGLWLASIDGSERDRQLAVGEIAFASFSPDGDWISYTDRTSGQSEVYVARVTHPGERTKITAQGGDQARWTTDGKIITYRDGQRWFAVDVSTHDGFVAGRPRLLFRGPFQQHPGWSYDVSRDGRRLLLMQGPPDETTNPLVVVTNWFADVKRLAPPR
jgi:DNA-binding SARP family transcriptional activator/Tol biopolymer transport system component